jgi:hypothetical protein
VACPSSFLGTVEPLKSLESFGEHFAKRILKA